jgi:hypothetical protein
MRRPKELTRIGAAPLLFSNEAAGASAAKAADLLRAGSRQGSAKACPRRGDTSRSQPKQAGGSCLTEEGGQMTHHDSAAHMDQLKHEASLCPSCEKRTGRLFGIMLKGPEKTLTYQCADCKQQWPVIELLPPNND